MNILNEVILEISQNCNLNCEMCGFGQKNNHPDKFMDMATFNQIFNEIKDHTKTIRLNGRGESTIHPHLLKMMETVGKQNINLTMFTNGNYVDQKLNNAFKEYHVQLFFSIDSPKKSLLEKIRTGAKYERILLNLKAMENIHPRPFIVFTLQEENIDEIVPIARFAIKYKCQLIYNVVRRDESMEPFIERIKNNVKQIQKDFNTVKSLFYDTDYECMIPDQVAGVPIQENLKATCGTRESCPLIEQEMTILYDGTVTPCNMFNPYEYGNILTSSFESIWNGKARELFKQNHKNNYYCQNCACLMEDVI